MSELTKADDSKSSEEQDEIGIAEVEFELTAVDWVPNVTHIYSEKNLDQSGFFRLKTGDDFVVRITLRSGSLELEIPGSRKRSVSMVSVFVSMSENVALIKKRFTHDIKIIAEKIEASWGVDQLFAPLENWSKDWDEIQKEIVGLHAESHAFSTKLAKRVVASIDEMNREISNVLHSYREVYEAEYKSVNDVMNINMNNLLSSSVKWSDVAVFDDTFQDYAPMQLWGSLNTQKKNSKHMFKSGQDEIQRMREEFSISMQDKLKRYEARRAEIVSEYSISEQSWPSLNYDLMEINIKNLNRDIFGLDWECFEFFRIKDVKDKQVTMHSLYTEEERRLDAQIKELKEVVRAKRNALENRYKEAHDYFSEKLKEVQGIEAEYATKKLGREYAGYANDTDKSIARNVVSFVISALVSIGLFSASIYYSSGSETVDNVLRVSMTVFIVSLTAYLARRITMLQKIQQHYAQRHVELSILREFFEDFPSDKKTEIVAELAPKFFGERVLDAKKEPDQLSVINELSGTLEKLAKITKEQTDKK